MTEFLPHNCQTNDRIMQQEAINGKHKSSGVWSGSLLIG